MEQQGCTYLTCALILSMYGLPETGLQEKIHLVPIDLTNMPDWYKEKVYPPNKVPALEHNDEVMGESLDLIKYLDTNFQGPALLPNDPAKREFAEELLSYTSDFMSGVIDSMKGDTCVGKSEPFQPVHRHRSENLSRFAMLKRYIHFSSTSTVYCRRRIRSLSLGIQALPSTESNKIDDEENIILLINEATSAAKDFIHIFRMKSGQVAT